jgi:hypothetical protein
VVRGPGETPSRWGVLRRRLTRRGTDGDGGTPPVRPIVRLPAGQRQGSGRLQPFGNFESALVNDGVKPAVRTVFAHYARLPLTRDEVSITPGRLSAAGRRVPLVQFEYLVGEAV